MHLIDTNVAIHFRDGDRGITALLNTLPTRPAMSIMTWTELEGGVYSQPSASEFRRAALDALLEEFAILPFDPAVVHAYSKIVAAQGFVRSRIFDRLIAATAIVHGLTLITINARDFRDIPGLSLEIWPAPAQ